jgi:Mn-dependent DtxR family transcriptional regulator
MRRSGSWQSVWDDRILEWIRENDRSGSAAQMKKSDLIRVSRPQISRRLQKLAEHGLVQHLGNGVYVLTDEGEAYLDEEYDAERGVYMNRDMSEEDSGNGADTASDV